MELPRSGTTKRHSKRTKAVVPVRLWIAGTKDIHLAHTLDVSRQGVRLTSAVHDRMPVILHPVSYDLWLEPGMKEGGRRPNC